MKTFLYINIFLIFLSIFRFSNEYLCPENQLSINSLGTQCKNISDILQNEELIIPLKNLIYLATNNDGIIEKSNYFLQIFRLDDERLTNRNIKRSNLYIPQSCMNALTLKSDIKLDKSKGILILVHDYNLINKNNLPEIYFVIRHVGDDSQVKYINSKTFDFSFCHEDPILYDEEIYLNNLTYDYDDTRAIDIEKILYAKKLKIDLFDPYSDFLNEICFKFKSEVNSDVTLESRLTDYYQNITLCNETYGAHYIGYNYSEEHNSITFRCAYGFYEDKEEQQSYLDDIDDKINLYVSHSNLKIISCYKEVLRYKNLINNYGGIICITAFLLQIILFMDFCCKGIDPLDEKIENMFAEAKIQEVPLNENTNFTAKGKNERNNLGEYNNILQNDNMDYKRNYLTNKKMISFQSKNMPKKSNLNNEVDNHLIILDIEKTDVINNDNQVNTKENILKSKSNNKNNNDDNVSEISQIYELNSDDLDELSYDKAIKRDKRCCFKYYCSRIKVSHIICNVFCRFDDYNLISIKCALLFMLIPITLSFNIFFLTNSEIKSIYINKIDDLSGTLNMIKENFLQTFLASIFASIVFILLKQLCITHSTIRSLRKIKDLKEAKIKKVSVLRCIKIRIFIYYIFSLCFLFVFGYYVICFCSIFENTQFELLKRMFSSWIYTLFYPLLLCIVTAIIRTSSLCCKIKICYNFSKLLQLF